MGGQGPLSSFSIWLAQCPHGSGRPIAFLAIDGGPRQFKIVVQNGAFLSSSSTQGGRVKQHARQRLCEDGRCRGLCLIRVVHSMSRRRCISATQWRFPSLHRFFATRPRRKVGGDGYEEEPTGR